MISYRPEIDGLRSIAVLAVIFYHADFTIKGVNPFRGGYIGVDVFFVISGYLITSGILLNLNEGSFSLKNFYYRRVRRILPALLFVKLSTIPFFYGVMIPKSLKDYAGSVISSLSFGSNFFFWKEDRYTAIESSLKPFLHTWSLSIEEQFYFIMPLLIMLLWKYFKDSLFTFLLFLFFISLEIANLGSRHFIDANFYLLPSRIWEMLAGSLLAYILYKKSFERKNPSELLNFLATLGLFLILHSILFFKSETPHPSFYTLFPVLGTCLIIGFSSKDNLTTKLLSYSPIVKIGLISYSLYLWHFPIFAFHRLISKSQSNETKLLLILIIFIFSIFSYFFIEKPLRNKLIIKNKYFFTVIFLTILTIAGIMGTFYAKEGMPERLNHPYTKDLEYHRVTLPEPLEKGTKKIFLTGDSIAGHFHTTLYEFAEKNNLSYERFESPGCVFTIEGKLIYSYELNNSRCNDQQEVWKNKIKSTSKSIIIMFARYPAYLSDGKGFKDQNGKVVFEGFYLDPQNSTKSALTITKDTIYFLRSLGHKVVFIGTFPEFTENVYQEVNSMIFKQNSWIWKNQENILNNYIAETINYDIYTARLKNVYAILDEFKYDPGFYGIDLKKYFCEVSTKRCSLIYNNSLITFDSSHPSKPVFDGIMKEIDQIIQRRNWLD